LSFYAGRFNAVEVNSTFYGQPRATVTLGWARRTPAAFEFAVKLYQKFTHPGMTADATAISPADVDTFKGGIDPLAAAGKLGPILAQFPSSFHRSPEAVAYLDWLLRTFSGYSLAVELRHVSWSDAAEDTRALLTAAHATWVQIDEPKFASSIRQDASVAATPSPGLPDSDVLYLRLHGRNAAQWWDHEQAEDRYNYLYSGQELAPIAERVRQARQAGKKVNLFLNNHFSAQAVANATTLKKMLDEPVTAPLPAELVERYPELDGVATLPRARLL
jgi:uncharacterized protein YecE (DUF72 family)